MRRQNGLNRIAPHRCQELVGLGFLGRPRLLKEASRAGVPLEGSERTPPPGATVFGPADPSQVIEVSVRLNFKQSVDVATSHVARGRHSERRILSREQFAEHYGADEAEVQAVERFARSHGLYRIPDLTATAVGAGHVATRTIELRGTAAAFMGAFGVRLSRYSTPSGTYRGYSGSIHIPEALIGVIQGVFGLDTRRAARPHFRRLPELGGAYSYAGAGQAYYPTDIAKIYGFPSGATGAGQTIGIIELGGGYRIADLNRYFRQLGIPRPLIKSVRVGTGANAPTGHPNGPDGEVMLDIEVAGAVAPDARIVVYFARNTTRGFLRAVQTAVHDTVNRPSIISISWGGAESTWSLQSMEALDSAFQVAALLGITVCVSAGDDGSSDGLSGRLAHVDFPASSSWVLACGGTQLSTRHGARYSEVVWNDGRRDGATGGGVSGVFAVPGYQAGANVPNSINPGNWPGRGVPDVAGNASPLTGYIVRADGKTGIVGGTSAVAPLWAGLAALLNQKLGRPVGFLNPQLYQAAGGGFFDVISGDNDEKGNIGGYAARPGWDPCTGLGAPNGEAILAALS